MNYANIKYNDIANGLGVRTSLFVSGCTHHCPGCFNEIAWDFSYGQEFTREAEDEIIKSLKPGYVSGLTILGGEPMEPTNQEALIHFLQRVKKEYPHKPIWCYTGYSYDKDLQPGGSVYGPYTKDIFSLLDYLVDGKFIQEQADISLRFRGSKNQRIIDLKKSDKTHIVELECL